MSERGPQHDVRAPFIIQIDDLHRDMKLKPERSLRVERWRAAEERGRMVRSLMYCATIIACVVMLLTCGCAKPEVTTPAHRPEIGQPRTIEVQRALSVRVEAGCFQGPLMGAGFSVGFYRGSATLLDGTHALTARHVVACEKREEGKLVERQARVLYVIVTMPDNTERSVIAEVEREDSDLDVALLRLRQDLGAVPPPALGHAKVGDEVCMLWEQPSPRGRQCGKVVKTDEGAGDLLHDIPTRPGNSGGGVYDRAGRLVGVTINRHWCDGIEMMIDMISPGEGKICWGGMSTKFREVL